MFLLSDVFGGNIQLEIGSPRHWTPAARPSNHPSIQPHKLPTRGNLCESKLTFHATECVSYPCPWIRQMSRDMPNSLTECKKCVFLILTGSVFMPTGLASWWRPWRFYAAGGRGSLAASALGDLVGMCISGAWNPEKLWWNRLL